MLVRISPSRLSGNVQAIASKSEAHRLLILSALASAPTRLVMRGTSDDIEATLDCIKNLGAAVRTDESGIEICPGVSIEGTAFNAGESGSTLRFMLPVASAVMEHAQFVGRGRLPKRPLTHLTEALKSHGVAFSSDSLPLETYGKLQSGVFTIPGNISSQYVTGLLLALPLLDGDSEIRVTGDLQSKAYVDITLRAMALFGLEAEKTESGYQIRGRQKITSPGTVYVDGDWSNAAFFLAAGAIGETGVSVSGLQANAPQGDKRIIDLLRGFGANITEKDGNYLIKGGRLRAQKIDIGEVPDLIAPLAVTAMFAEGTTEFVNGSRLRIKESDRINTMRNLINALGGKSEDVGDVLIVHGQKPLGGTVDGANDHRICMAAAIAGAYSPNGCTITGAEAVNKSYPGFYLDFMSIGGIQHVV